MNKYSFFIKKSLAHCFRAIVYPLRFFIKNIDTNIIFDFERPPYKHIPCKYDAYRIRKYLKYKKVSATVRLLPKKNKIKITFYSLVTEEFIQELRKKAKDTLKVTRLVIKVNLPNSIDYFLED